ncbi:MAG: hypothetical protein WDO15_10305 [Bacteroidota bacterium]
MSIKSILTGSEIPLRKTRFHDEKGNKVSTRDFIVNGPKALMSLVGLKLFGMRPEKPWLSYNGISYLDKFLNKNKTVLEFGSGMSTVWFAKKSGKVYSAENYEPWHTKVSGILKSKGMSNVQYSFLEGNAFSSYMADSGIKFDLVLVDGYGREKCMDTAIKVINDRDGIIYLDNSDKDSNPAFAKDRTREAEDKLLAFAKSKGGEVTYFSDFAPTAFFVQQGLMARFKS